jgi:hypothetical protein
MSIKVHASIAKVLASAVLLAISGFGQYPGFIKPGVDGEVLLSATMNDGSSLHATEIVIEAPYSGEEITQQTQILADGSRVSNSRGTVQIWRDSAGRVRAERPILPGGDHVKNMPYIIDILDPPAGYRYYMDTEKKVVHRCKLPKLPKFKPSDLGPLVAPGSAGLPPFRPIIPSGSHTVPPEVTSELIGSQVFEGIPAEGVRNTVAYPAGSIGNESSIVSTMETWHSGDLHVTMLSKQSDPRTGETVRRLINLSLEEPSPELFQVPEDYTMVDETGSFTVTFTRRD